MELLAIGSLAYLGTIINEHIISEYDKNGSKKKDIEYFNSSKYQNNEVSRINKKYQKRVKEIKDLSFIPDQTKVIPSFYNQLPAVGEEYKEQKIPIPGRLETGFVSEEFNILDKQFEFGEIKKKDPSSNGFELEIADNWTPFKETGDMTYGIFKKEELKHNNMQPFFRRRDESVENNNGKMVDDINSNNNMTKMELFTGSSKNYYPKEAPPPFFEPMKDVHFVNGMPDMTDKIQDRYIPGNQRRGEKPFQEIKVQPGLGLGYNEESKIGFHDSYRAPEPTIDFQRVGNRIQKTNAGVIIPGMKGQKQPVDPNVAKRRPEKAFDVSEYIHGGGNGGVTKPAVNPDQIAKDQNRANSMELKNGASMASGSLVGPFNPDGEKRDPHKLQFEGYDMQPAQMQSVNNNNLPSYYLLENQRTETGYNYYDGVATNKEMNKVGVFNTQPTNTTLRQTTAETAQDGAAYGDVKKGNQFNLQAANTTLRQTTAETAQDGIAYGDVRKGNQFNLQPTNTTLRQTTAETFQDGPAYGDVRKGNQFNLQPTNSTLRQTTAETAQDGVAYGDVRKVHQLNTQPTNTTLRQTTAETAQDGAAHGDVRKVHQFNTQPTNTTLRQTTAETAQDGPGFGQIKKVHQLNTQAANATHRQNTTETPQENPAFGGVQKVHQFNKQPANSTLRQVTNYDNYQGPTHVLVEEPRSRLDANNMTVHSSREDTTASRTMTYSGWNEGISTMTHGTQNSKQKDINNNWTRVNPPSAGSRSNALQDMGFGLDDRIVYQLNKLKQFPSMGDRIETSVAQVLQNNELINNAYQKYQNK